jgi:K+-transporting ATPase A subunit
LVKYPIESRNLSANTPHINRLLTRFTTSSQNSNLKAETLWRNGAVMESTLYVLAMMIARFVVPLALLLLFGSWVEKRQTSW